MSFKKFWSDLIRRTTPAANDTLLLGNALTGDAQYCTAEDLPMSKAALAYINKQIADLKASGAVGNSLAGSMMPWPGTAASVPQDWMLIPQVKTLLVKTAYPDLYNALGGEASPWGVTATQFYLPYIPAGYGIVQTGTGYALAQTGGAETVTLKTENTEPHNHPSGNMPSGDDTGLKASGGNAVGRTGKKISADDWTEKVGGKDGKAVPFNIMNPYVALPWIIKLKNTGGSFTAAIDANGHLVLTFADGSTQDAGLAAAPGAVVYDKVQTLIAAEKAQARANIDAAAIQDVADEIQNRQQADAALLANINTRETAGVAASLVTQVINGASAGGDTLKYLEDRIAAAEAIIGSSTGDANNVVDTVREILAVFTNVPEGVSWINQMMAKVNTVDVYNALDCIISGKVLDARQGKVLFDALAKEIQDRTTSESNLQANIDASKSPYFVYDEPSQEVQMLDPNMAIAFVADGWSRSVKYSNGTAIQVSDDDETTMNPSYIRFFSRSGLEFLTLSGPEWAGYGRCTEDHNRIVNFFDLGYNDDGQNLSGVNIHSPEWHYGYEKHSGLEDHSGDENHAGSERHYGVEDHEGLVAFYGQEYHGQYEEHHGQEDHWGYVAYRGNEGHAGSESHTGNEIHAGAVEFDGDIDFEGAVLFGESTTFEGGLQCNGWAEFDGDTSFYGAVQLSNAGQGSSNGCLSFDGTNLKFKVANAWKTIQMV